MATARNEVRSLSRRALASRNALNSGSLNSPRISAMDSRARSLEASSSTLATARMAELVAVSCSSVEPCDTSS